MEQAENQVKITNKQRIIRIFQKICQSNIQVLIRSEVNSTTVIKASAKKLISTSSSSHDDKKLLVRLSEISENGIDYLSGKHFVQLEFALISNKLVCSSRIYKIKNDEILVELPKSLTSIERRANMRFKTKPEICAYVELSKWKISPKDLPAKPYFESHQHLAAQILVCDISIGGLCLKTFFPSTTAIVSKDLLDENAKITFPLKPQLKVGLNIRWVKKINEHIKISDTKNQVKTFYLVGCQFTEETNEAINNEVKLFIRQIQESGLV